MKFLIPIIICIVIIVGIILFFKMRKKKPVVEEKYNFSGPAYSNIIMYKAREEKTLNYILANYNKFTKESLINNIEEIAKRLVNGQNNGYISETAFQKTAIDNVLLKMKEMKQVDISIINFEYGYMSVAVIFEGEDKNLYQLLMKMNVQNGLLYLDSYNATFWFKNE